ncbi:MAG: hydantoinase/carbamoylase family amidase [Alkalilacustris sp.]
MEGAGMPAQGPLGLEIVPAEIERMVLALSDIGRHGDTGVWRTAYSPQWRAANALLAQWFAQAGLAVRSDAVGNLWGRAEGRRPGPAVVSGSHVDSQCPGGRYDGALGILAALVAVRALMARFGPPLRPLEVVSLCEEEGSRFPTAGFWGSRALTGRIAPGDPEAVTDPEGRTIAQAMRDCGFDPDGVATARRDDLHAFVELHIEQGPILEQAGLPVGFVTGITGIRHTEVVLTGEANHAGAFPMDLRRDPMQGFAEIAARVVDHAHRMGRPAVTTVGRVRVEPNAPAIVPARVIFTIDARHPDQATHQAMERTHQALIAEVAARRGLGVRTRVLFDHAASPSAPHILRAMRASAAAHGIGGMDLHSGAGHDAQQIAALCPVAMVFVRSAGGRSHTPEEFSSIPDIVAGIRVLAGTLHSLAYGED